VRDPRGNQCQCRAPGPKGCGGEYNGNRCYPVEEADGTWRCGARKKSGHHKLVGTGLLQGCAPCDRVVRPEFYEELKRWEAAKEANWAEHVADSAPPPGKATAEKADDDNSAWPDKWTPGAACAAQVGKATAEKADDSYSAWPDEGAACAAQTSPSWWGGGTDRRSDARIEELEDFAAEAMNRIVILEKRIEQLETANAARLLAKGKHSGDGKGKGDDKGKHSQGDDKGKHSSNGKGKQGDDNGKGKASTAIEPEVVEPKGKSSNGKGKQGDDNGKGKASTAIEPEAAGTDDTPAWQ
jgi:hypothetical protein